MHTHKIAVIVGAGDMPTLVIDALKRDKSSFIALALKGYADETMLRETNYIPIDLGQLGTTLKLLKQNDVTKVVFAGGIKRPPLLSLKLDKTALMLLAKLGMNRLSGGDDNLMKLIVNFLTKQGFEVCAPESIVPDMLVEPGSASKVKPSKQHLKDIEVGKQVLRALGKMDVGQSVVVENGYVLGIEAAEGSDQLILRCGALKKEKPRLGVVVKMKKLNQEKRIDLPAIGTTTIQNLYDAGFAGIALEASSSLIINKNEVVNLANKLGIFIIGVKNE